MMKNFLGLAVLAALMAGCGGGDKTPESTGSLVISGGYGSKASITYQSNGIVEQATVLLPHTEVLYTVQPGEFLYISAQNRSGSGSVSVSIEVNGRTVKSATSSGAYGIATASYTCC